MMKSDRMMFLVVIPAGVYFPLLSLAFTSLDRLHVFLITLAWYYFWLMVASFGAR